jgi:divalent metal cation (Fe/Co/Zn/Cd) transporter
VSYELVLPLLGMGIGVFVLYNGFRIARHALDQKHERDLAKAGGAAPGEVAELRDRVERLEGIASRVQELEERQDFTERVLTRGREQAGGPS